MNGFTIYKEYYDLITLLPEKDQEKMLLAIMKYMFNDEEPRLNEKQLKIFNNLRRPLMKSKEQSKRKTKQQPNENQTETKLKPNNNQTKTHQDVNVIVNVNNNLYEYIEDNLGRTLSPIEYELISTWDDNELTRYAVKQTVLNRATSLKYTQAILNAYKAKGITSVMEAEKENKKRHNKAYTPEWFNESYKQEPLSDEETNEMSELLKEFKN